MSYLYYAFNNVSEASSVSQVGYNLEGDRVWKVEKAPKGVNWQEILQHCVSFILMRDGF